MKFDYKTTDNAVEHDQRLVTRGIQMYSYEHCCKRMHIYKITHIYKTFFLCMYKMGKNIDIEHYIRGYVRYYKPLGQEVLFC